MDFQEADLFHATIAREPLAAILVLNLEVILIYIFIVVACGFCLSFSTTRVFEGTNFIKTGNLVPLSKQIFVDCDAVDHGCNGVLMENAFRWEEEDNGGVCSEDDYPYQAIQDFY